MNEAGILYVAYGAKAVEECVNSIRSVRVFHPEMQAAVVSAVAVPQADIWIEQPDLDVTARSYKTRAYEFSPFEYTLYLDADTRVVGPLGGGLVALRQGWEMCIAIDCTPTIGEFRHIQGEEAEATVAEVGTSEMMQFNSGVIFFRKCPAAQKLYAAWYEEWQRWGRQDQAALVRALQRAPLKIWYLGGPWNSHKQAEARIVWHRHRCARREGSP